MIRKDIEWKLQLQLFAEDPAPDEPDPEGDPKPNDPKPNPEPKPEAKYTDEDLDRIIGKKFAEWEKKKQKDLDEAKKLANMTADEKREKELSDLKSRLAEFESAATKASMATAARAIFEEKEVNAPDAIVNMLIADDAESTKKAVEAYIDVFQNEVKKAVKEALKGTEPPKGSGNPTSLTKEQIMKVANRSERQRLIRENPSLFGI